MEWLNYHHLHYFWVVAHEGSIARAADRLRLAKATVSAQLRLLEDSVGRPLYERRGRRLVLTEAGTTALRHADEIFATGRRMLDEIRAGSARTRLVVGISDALPKPIVRRLLAPALDASTPVRLICREDRPVDDFVAELASHIVDVVLSDAPLAPSARSAAHAHLLGESGTSLFFARARAAALRRGFPQSLRTARWLLPGSASGLRLGLERWLLDHDIAPHVVGEFDDSALVNIFGQDGAGVFAGPTVIAADICRRYDVGVVGDVPELRQRFYAITLQRRLAHPAVRAICDSARRDLFG
ncbi:MAG: LysR family transcriptional regulator [Nannocystaceae bacterium]|jgi:LysR family transcriptional activator of nhaA